MSIFAPSASEQIALDVLQERERRGEIPRPGFDFPTRLQGITDHFHIFYDPNLGAIGAFHADAVLAVCEKDYSTIQGYFGGITPRGIPFNMIIAPPSIGGAYHYGCDGIDLYCADSFDTDFIKMLAVAEEVEAFSDKQGLGWDCTTTNGEALSRVLAEALYPSAAVPIASEWLNKGRPDYITENASPLPDGTPADRDQVSNACGVLFLNWLHYQLGFSWDKIVQAGAPSLGQTYTKLTGQTDAFTRFKALMQANFPEGIPVYLQTNNPFPLPENASVDERWYHALLLLLIVVAIARN